MLTTTLYQVVRHLLRTARSSTKKSRPRFLNSLRMYTSVALL